MAHTKYDPGPDVWADTLKATAAKIDMGDNDIVITDPGLLPHYVQKCVDGVTGLWVYWKTTFKDIGGQFYPGDSFDAATYLLVSTIWT